MQIQFGLKWLDWTEHRACPKISNRFGGVRFVYQRQDIQAVR
jgi:hypothetical protein